VKVYEKFHDQGFEVIGVSLDRSPSLQKRSSFEKSPEEILFFTKANRMPWPQHYDGKYWANELAVRFGVDAIPFMLLLDQKGMIVSTNARGPKLEEEVRRLLRN
jgi:alkyl hydroperoxide reductase subunit AhpC